MDSSRSSRFGFLSELGRTLDSPPEWTEALVSVDCESLDWRGARLTRNGGEIPLFVSNVDGRDRVLGRWPRSGAGNYELRLSWADGSWEESRVCTVEPMKLSAGAVASMVDHLNRRLPASIALALRRGGALSGMEIVPPGETTLAEEVSRLSRAVDGTETRAGLTKVLRVLAKRPHRVLQPQERWAGRHQVRRVDPVRLLQAFGRPSNLSSDRLPITVPERPVAHSADVYENRLLKTFCEQVDIRLRAVIRALDKRGDQGLVRHAEDMLASLSSARHQASFLSQVSPLSEPPSRVSMLLLRRTEYRALVEGFLEFRRSAIVHLQEPAIDAPLENLPFLYQSWGVLETLSVVLDLAVDHGYEVLQERLAIRDKGELWIRLLADGDPVAELVHRGSGTSIRIIPQRRYPVGQKAPRSISFEQIPDIAVEIARGRETAVYLFDPKYKLHGEEVDGPTSRPKKVDVDSMHAYRDAIRGVDGERVVKHASLLYPGETRHYGPGLSAVQAQPESYDDLRRELGSTLRTALDVSAPVGPRHAATPA